ncbi:hypothetical protein JCM5353_004285 [Sporobolomyces roseus]
MFKCSSSTLIVLHALLVLLPFTFASPPSFTSLSSILGAGHYVHLSNTSILDPQSSYNRSIHRWQSDSSKCKMQRYSKDEILDCLQGERIVIWGDSTARVLYYGLVNKLSPTLVTDKHANRFLEFSPSNNTPELTAPSEATLDFRWDPLLGVNHDNSFDPVIIGGLMPTNFPNPWSSTLEQQAQDLPLAMVIMVGLWYTDHREGMHPNLLIPQWKIRVGQLLEAAEKRKIVKDLLVLAEVEVPTDRDDGNVHKKDDVDEMNRWLRETFNEWVKSGKQNKAKTRVVLATGFNSIISPLSDRTPDGLHYPMDVAETQADLLLNAICSNRSIGNDDEGKCWSEGDHFLGMGWQIDELAIVLIVAVGVIGVLLRKSQLNLIELSVPKPLRYVKLTLPSLLLPVYRRLFTTRPSYSALGTDTRGNRYELVSQS